jgi:4'-phosphopantetheinyl transferase
LITVIWSAKEAALKALRHGLRVDTRSIEILHVARLEGASANGIEPSGQMWHKVQIRCTLPNSSAFYGWWRPWENHVLTIATRE